MSQDHATWISFTNEELEKLHFVLRIASTSIMIRDEVDMIRDRIAIYTADDAKDPVFRAAAKDQPFMRDGECEIDDHAVVSASDEGAYVMAWVWVSNEDAGIEEPEEDE